MKPLPDTFSRQGFNHRLVERTGNRAIFARGKPGRREHYEVVIIRCDRERLMHGTVLPASERYPGNNDWGSYGWTCLTLEDARQRLTALL